MVAKSNSIPSALIGNLSIGDLIITYSKTNVGGEIFEYLEISNTEMFDYTIDEEVINVTG